MRKIIAFVLSFLICGLTFMSCSTLKTMKQSVLGASEDDILQRQRLAQRKSFMMSGA